MNDSTRQFYCIFSIFYLAEAQSHHHYNVIIIIIIDSSWGINLTGMRSMEGYHHHRDANLKVKN